MKANCSECKREFMPRHDKIKTCSAICSRIRGKRIKKEKKLASGWEPKMPNTPRYERVCLECKKEYLSCSIHGKYCSPSCKGKHRRVMAKKVTKQIKEVNQPVFEMVRPRSVAGHDDELRKEIQRFLRAGGKIKRYRYFQPDPAVEIQPSEYSVIQDLAGV